MKVHYSDHQPLPGTEHLSREDAATLVYGHWGIGGEFANGLGQYAVMLGMPASRRMSFKFKLKALVDKLDGPSQLAAATEGGGPLQQYAATHHLETESGEQALWRCVDQAECWARANDAALPPETKAALGEAIAEYRTTYLEVLNYAKDVRQYLGDLGHAGTLAGQISEPVAGSGSHRR